jgi:two-component system, OmpR family, manganese sensing sensor histidine kinase
MSLILPTPLSKTSATVSSNRIPKTRFKFSYRRILLAYLAATAAILGGCALATYSLIDYTLRQQLDDRLFTVAQGAIPSLEIVKTQDRQDLRELPWRKLFANKNQSWEWFDANGKLLLSQGTRFPSFPLSRKLFHSHWQPITPVFQQQGELRVVTVSVYIGDAKLKTLKLEGYIRVSESTQPLEIILVQLWLYLGCQGIAILFLIGICGVHFSQWNSQPMQQSFRQLKQTVTNISHHLRHPLTRITLAIALLAGEAESALPADDKKLTIVANATDELEHLVEDLLILTRSEVAVLPTELEAVNIRLEELLLPLLEQFDNRATSQGITFQAQLLPGLSVRGDPIHLSRMFSNLLDNAIAYTETGGSISLTVRKFKCKAIISVEDTGVGIPPEHHASIFQWFWRSEQAQQQQKGLGLGLAIAQAIAKQHGGEISVKSQANVGSCFQVTIPLF